MTGHEGDILQAVYAPGGESIVTSSADRSLKVWDAATLEEKHVLASQPDWVQALAFSPDGAYLAAGRYDGVTVLYETEGWTEVRSW
jgi:WD40 repeat protein